MKTRLNSTIIAVALVCFMAGCSDDESRIFPREGKFTGPVTGLEYSCGDQAGLTDADGTFYYESGKTVSFKIGNIDMGQDASTRLRFDMDWLDEANPLVEGEDLDMDWLDKVSPQLKLTSRDLVPEAESDRDAGVTNIRIFLEALDSDGNPDNGIVISESVRSGAESYDGNDVDFSLSETEFAIRIQPVVDDLMGRRVELASRGEAQNRLIRRRIQNLLDDAVESDSEIPGVALSAETPCAGGEGCVNGRYIWNFTSGYRDTEKTEPMTTDTRFRVGSTTKTFTGMVVMQLVEEGKLGIYDPISLHLPEDVVENLATAYDVENIAIYHLLTHTSGIAHFTQATADWEVLILNDPEKQWTPAELVDLAVNLGPDCQPGESFHYSNTGFVLLGMIIEEITGSDWETEIRERVIEPLGLSGTVVPETGDTSLPDPYARGYLDMEDISEGFLSKDSSLVDRGNYDPSWYWSSGDIISTPEDLRRFIQAVDQGELLNEETHEQWMSSFYGDGSMAVGLALFKNNGHGAIGHPGEVHGYNTSMQYHQEGEIAIAAIANRTLKYSLNIHDLVLWDALEILVEDTAGLVSLSPGKFAGEVAGMTCEYGDSSGITDAGGNFYYEAGEEITFRLGNIVIGNSFSTDSDETGTLHVSTKDLVPNAENNRDTTLTNVNVFLQTLDEDGNPENGIFLSGAVRARALEYDRIVDFSLDETGFGVAAQDAVDELLGYHRELVPRIEAQNHSIKTNLKMIMDKVMEDGEIPGLALSAETPCDGGEGCEGGRYVWNVVSGHRDLEKTAPITADMHFRIGSVTKTFVGMTVMQLVQEGLLGLDDAISTRLPEDVVESLSAAYDPETLTIRQLLQHMSGIAHFPDDQENWLVPYFISPETQWTDRELVEIAVGLGPEGEVGEFNYSNTNFVLLGMIVEEVAGTPWQTEVQTRFIDTLELSGTSVPDTGDMSLPEPYAAGYADLADMTDGFIPDHSLVDRTALDPSFLGACGNMISTPEDMRRWIGAIGEGRLLDEATQSEYMSSITYLSENFGVGLAIIDNVGRGAIGHPGRVIGYDTSVQYHGEAQISIVTIANRTLKGGEGIHNAVLWEALAMLVEDTAVAD